MQWKCGEGPELPAILVRKEDVLKRQMCPPLSGHQTTDTMNTAMELDFPPREGWNPAVYWTENLSPEHEFTQSDNLVESSTEETRVDTTVGRAPRLPALAPLTQWAGVP